MFDRSSICRVLDSIEEAPQASGKVPVRGLPEKLMVARGLLSNPAETYHLCLPLAEAFNHRQLLLIRQNMLIVFFKDLTYRQGGQIATLDDQSLQRCRQVGNIQTGDAVS